jgi:hypothetical protein
MTLEHLVCATLAFLAVLPILPGPGAANAASSSGEAAPLSKELTDLAAASESIVVARVAAIHGREEGGTTVTQVVLEVTETLRGVAQKKIVLDLDDKDATSGGEQAAPPPALGKGDEVLVFVERQSDGKPIIAGGHRRGLSRVKREASGRPILQGGAADGLPLSDLGSLKNGAASGTVDVARGASGSGIEGEVMIGPTKPSHRIGSPPDVAPYETTLVIEADPSGKEVVRVKSGPDGRFRVALPAGDYIVRSATPEKLLPRVEPVQVMVLPGQFAHVTINIDSGMR